MRQLLRDLLSYLEPGFLFGPQLVVHPNAMCAPGLATAEPLGFTRRWPFEAHPDALGFFERRRVIADPTLLRKT